MANNNNNNDIVDSNNGETTCPVRAALKSSIYHRQASLTPVEKTFLSALLIDKQQQPNTAEEEEIHKRHIKNATRVLNDDILFSIPIMDNSRRTVDALDESAIEISNSSTSKKYLEKEESSSHPKPPKPTRSNEAQLDLWKAHGDGVRPKLLKEVSQRVLLSSKSSINQSKSTDSELDGRPGAFIKNKKQHQQQHRRRKNSAGSPLKKLANEDSKQSSTTTTTNNSEDVLFPDTSIHSSLDNIIESDEEVGTRNDDSTASSWNSSQGGFDHYDAWEVIRDEYAEDFGFNVAVDDESQLLPYNDEDESNKRGMFKILGTNAEDTRSLPHVLSPPLMDSLLNFVPDHLSYNNYWLKFSLIRDGASLDILKRYCRAATHTILAIETTNGQVFGAFSSAPWRLSNRYFGTGEAFLWRMRHGRNTTVHSLFEQAQLESEIDVFPYNGSNDYIQLCTSDKLALGGGNILKKGHTAVQEDEPFDAPAVFLEDNVYGFGLALDKNLLHGTTSPSATFGNANLINNSESGETFDVMNLEVWGFTSAQTEKDAEKSEMSMFFVRESISSNMSSSRDTSVHSMFDADDLSSQEQFYRRIGQNDENESDRDAWQYTNMMNPVAGSPYRSMGTPYGR